MQVTKGERAVIKVAGSDVEVFMLPNGEYRYSQTSAAQALDKKEGDIRQYLRESNPEAANGSQLVAVGRTRVKGLTEEAVTQYWQWKAGNGNQQALALVTALAGEALRRRADAAFGTTQSEAVYEAKTAQIRTELLQRCVSGYDWKPSTRQVGRASGWNTIELPSDATPDEAEVLQDAGYLKFAYGSGYATLVPNIVKAAEERLSARGYQVVEGQLQPV